MIRSRNILKQFYETGDKPTEEQFSDWLDSYIHINEDVIDTLTSSDSKKALSAKQGKTINDAFVAHTLDPNAHGGADHEYVNGDDQELDYPEGDQNTTATEFNPIVDDDNKVMLSVGDNEWGNIAVGGSLTWSGITYSSTYGTIKLEYNPASAGTYWKTFADETFNGLKEINLPKGGTNILGGKFKFYYDYQSWYNALFASISSIVISQQGSVYKDTFAPENLIVNKYGLIGPKGLLKNNFAATSNPTVSDDISQGYSCGSRWLNTNTGKVFTCTNNSVSAAVWDLGTGESADEVSYDNSTSGLLGTDVQAALDDVGDIVKSKNYVSGTNKNLTEPDDTYNSSSQLQVVGDDTSDSVKLFLGDYSWSIASGSVGSNVIWIGDNVGSSYGVLKISLNLGSTWVQFASYSNNGLKTFYLPKLANGDSLGGYFKFYYDYQSWYNAFNEDVSDIIISQNGSVYKGTLEPQNLVIDYAGRRGPSGFRIDIDLKNNLSASVVPTVSDDDTEGYSVGSRWINISSGKIYTCTDSSTGAAVWSLGSGETAEDTTYDNSTSGLSAINVQDAIDETVGRLEIAENLLIPEVYSSGIDQHLDSPSDEFDTVAQLVPVSDDGDDTLLLIGDYSWRQLNTVAGSSVSYDGDDVGTAYGSIILSVVSGNWKSFANNSNNGLKTFYLPKLANGDSLGGYFKFYYDYQSWYNALFGINSSIVISQNGDVYKGSLSPQNLIVDHLGKCGDLAYLKNNFAATSNPTVSDDESQGYRVGSRWINLSSDKIYTCVDSSVSAAVWDLGTGESADEVSYDNSTSGLLGTDVQAALDETHLIHFAKVYVTGTDQNLSEPDDTYSPSDQISYISDDNDDASILVGDHQWDASSIVVGTTVSWVGQNVGTIYGSIKFSLSSLGSYWENFAEESSNGLKTFTLPKSGGASAGGYFKYYYDKNAWYSAFSGQSDDIVISQNGDVYKGSISSKNLVITKDGVNGPSGVRKNNLIATTDPDENSDSTLGYAPLSIWYNTLTKSYFTCISSVVGSALWRSLFLSSTSPTVNEDSAHGFSLYSMWVNQTSSKVYILVDNTVGLANWVDLTFDTSIIIGDKVHKISTQTQFEEEFGDGSYDTTVGTAYTSGDFTLDSDSDDYDFTGFIPINQSGTVNLDVGDLQWDISGTGYVTYSGGSEAGTAGSVKFSANGSNWDTFSNSYYNGLHKLHLPKDANNDGDGGEIIFYYHRQAWYNAFKGNQSDIVITTDGSVYKGSISSSNLVVSGTGALGAASLIANKVISENTLVFLSTVSATDYGDDGTNVFNSHRAYKLKGEVKLNDNISVIGFNQDDVVMIKDDAATWEDDIRFVTTFKKQGQYTASGSVFTWSNKSGYGPDDFSVGDLLHWSGDNSFYRIISKTSSSITVNKPISYTTGTNILSSLVENIQMSGFSYDGRGGVRGLGGSIDNDYRWGGGFHIPYLGNFKLNCRIINHKCTQQSLPSGDNYGAGVYSNKSSVFGEVLNVEECQLTSNSVGIAYGSGVYGLFYSKIKVYSCYGSQVETMNGVGVSGCYYCNIETNDCKFSVSGASGCFGVGTYDCWYSIIKNKNCIGDDGIVLGAGSYYCNYSDIENINCKINTDSGANGGGASYCQYSRIKNIGCSVDSSLGSGPTGGGAAYCHNSFIENIACTTNEYGGGARECNESKIINNGCTATLSGGGSYLCDNCEITNIDCTAGVDGGGSYQCDNSRICSKSCSASGNGGGAADCDSMICFGNWDGNNTDIYSNGKGWCGLFYNDGTIVCQLFESTSDTLPDAFTVPSGAGGSTLNAAGEICVDTTSKTFNFYSDAEYALTPIYKESKTIENPTSSENKKLFYTDEAITIRKMVAVLKGSSTPSVTWTVRFAANRNAGGTEVVTLGTTTTSVTTGSIVVSFNDATIPADNFVWLETTAQSGTVTDLDIDIFFTQDP